MTINQQVISPIEFTEEGIEPFEMVSKMHFERILELESDSEIELEHYGIINYSSDTPESSSDSINEMNDS